MTDFSNTDYIRFGKQFSTFVNFIISIRAGKTHIIFAPEYVVMDRKSFELMANKHEEIKFVEFDQLDNWFKERFTKSIKDD